jgi:CMP-N,N'-diacetyllegionaminic acid synthase
MIRNAPLIAVIPVRAGSKGIPGKNLHKIGKYNLLERAIRLAKAEPRIDRIVVSTDSPEMHATALQYDVAAPVLRPAHLANDQAKTSDVVLDLAQTLGIVDTHVLLLQVTSPLRTKDDLAQFLNAYDASRAPAAASVVRQDEPRPEKLQRILDCVLLPYMGSGFEGPRQLLPQPFALNGAFYAIAVAELQKHGKFLPAGTLAFEMQKSRSHNLDTQTDMDVLEAMVAAGKWHVEDL